MHTICYNGKFFDHLDPVLKADNRSFKYGDGVFETMKVYNGNILLKNLHADRLFSSLRILDIKTIYKQFDELEKIIIELCTRNNCSDLARVRLSFFRNELDHGEYVIEAMPLENYNRQFNETGLVIDCFPLAKKTIDSYANLKSANFLPYTMAARFADAKGLDDCFILNSLNNVCETSKANMFLFKDDNLITPALAQGCINGVMRRYLIDQCNNNKYDLKEDSISEEDLLEADEIFLTNAVYNIRWVKQFKNRKYTNKKTKELFIKFVSTFYW